MRRWHQDQAHVARACGPRGQHRQGVPAGRVGLRSRVRPGGAAHSGGLSWKVCFFSDFLKTPAFVGYRSRREGGSTRRQQLGSSAPPWEAPPRAVFRSASIVDDDGRRVDRRAVRTAAGGRHSDGRAVTHAHARAYAQACAHRKAHIFTRDVT